MVLPEHDPHRRLIFELAERLGHADPYAMAAGMPASVFAEWQGLWQARHAEQERAAMLSRNRRRGG